MWHIPKATYTPKYFEIAHTTTCLDGFHLISCFGKVTLHPDPGLLGQVS